MFYSSCGEGVNVSLLESENRKKIKRLLKELQEMSHSVIFVYEDKHFLGVCVILCVHIKVFTNQAEINSLPFH